MVVVHERPELLFCNMLVWIINPLCVPGIHPGFFNWGGGSISGTVQPPTLHEVGGGNFANTDLIGPVGAFPSCTAHQIYYRTSESVQNRQLCDLL